jgi:hypothetical protein
MFLLIMLSIPYVDAEHTDPYETKSSPISSESLRGFVFSHLHNANFIGARKNINLLYSSLSPFFFNFFYGKYTVLKTYVKNPLILQVINFLLSVQSGYIYFIVCSNFFSPCGGG